MKKLLSIILIVISLYSCKENNPVNNQPVDNLNKIYDSFLVDLPSGYSINDIIGKIDIGESILHINNKPEIRSTEVWGKFYNSIHNYQIDAGTFSLNGEIINKSGYYVPNQSDSTFDYLQSLDDITINSTIYNINVSGSSLFPTFSGSIISPKSEVKLTSPVLNQNISKSSPLTVTWDCLHDSKNKVAIYLDGNLVSISKFTDDTGSYSITSDDLSKLQDNNITIQIMIYNYNFVKVNNKLVFVSVFTSYITTINLVA